MSGVSTKLTSMKTNYKNHLLETIENIYKANEPDASIASIYAKMYGSLSAVVTTEQLELLLELALKSALAKSNAAVIESQSNTN